jgi:hypothetical protein
MKQIILTNAPNVTHQCALRGRVNSPTGPMPMTGGAVGEPQIKWPTYA